MSIIAAIADSFGIWIGSDTLISSNDLNYGDIHGPKWILSSDCRAAIGVCGWLHAQQALEYKKEGLFQALSDSSAFVFGRKIALGLKECGYERSNGNGSPPMEDFGQNVMVVEADRRIIWAYSPNFDVIEWPEGRLAATGSGEVAALAAGKALNGIADMFPMVLGGSDSQKFILQRSIEAAISLSPGCGGDVWIERIE